MLVSHHPCHLGKQKLHWSGSKFVVLPKSAHSHVSPSSLAELSYGLGRASVGANSIPKYFRIFKQLMRSSVLVTHTAVIAWVWDRPCSFTLFSTARTVFRILYWEAMIWHCSWRYLRIISWWKASWQFMMISFSLRGPNLYGFISLSLSNNFLYNPRTISS